VDMWRGRNGGGMMKMWLRSVGGWGRVGSMLLSRGSKRASTELIGTGGVFFVSSWGLVIMIEKLTSHFRAWEELALVALILIHGVLLSALPSLVH